MIACDAWQTVRENLRAVWYAVAALRDLERCKASEILERAFRRFLALPGASKEVWYHVLGITCDASLEEAQAAYRSLALVHHPDRGGTEGRMAELNAAIDEARQAVRAAAG